MPAMIVHPSEDGISVRRAYLPIEAGYDLAPADERYAESSSMIDKIREKASRATPAAFPVGFFQLYEGAVEPERIHRTCDPTAQGQPPEWWFLRVFRWFASLRLQSPRHESERK